MIKYRFNISGWQSFDEEEFSKLSDKEVSEFEDRVRHDLYKMMTDGALDTEYPFELKIEFGKISE